MDEYTSKRAIDGVVVPKKGMNQLFRDTANTRDRNGQVCSRVGCSSKVNSPKGAQIGSSVKGKSLRTSFRSVSNGKEAIGNSSRTFSGNTNPGKPLLKPRKTLSSSLETDSSETSSVQDEPEVSNLAPLVENSQRGLQAVVESAESSNAIQMEVGSSSVASNSRSRRNFHPKPGMRGQEIKSTSPMTRAATSRYGLKNLKCNSISDVIPATGCSSSESTFKKRNCEGEGSSTARGKKMSGSSFEGRNPGSRNGISISEARRSRNIPHSDRPDNNNNNNNATSVRTRRPISGHARGRPSSQGNANHVASNDSLVMIPHLPRFGSSNAPGFSHHSSVEAPLSSPSTYNRPGTSGEELFGVLPVSPTEYSITHSVMNRDSFQRCFNMDGIAEVLLALERIEQDVELTHEQILLLESNLLLTGLNFYDRHRDMRLDIDNMSYEELLALEERMGTVSTAVSEEALSECLKRSFYQFSFSDDAAKTCNENKDDTKCSICQEEYVAADEVGSLRCEHMYHTACIQQWLKLKNWCPICKASVAQSKPCSSSN